MSSLWIAPLAIVWLRVWGPLRPFDVEPVSPPSWIALLAGTTISMAAWWVPAGYYKLRDFEKSGRIYEMLGVRSFSRFVTDGAIINRIRRQATPGFRLIRDRASARAFIARTYIAERGHLPWLVAGLLSTIWAARVGWNGWALLLGAGNALVNLWPILLQRYTRGRIERVLTASAAKK
jgi:hypothetical protein